MRLSNAVTVLTMMRSMWLPSLFALGSSVRSVQNDPLAGPGYGFGVFAVGGWPNQRMGRIGLGWIRHHVVSQVEWAFGKKLSNTIAWSVREHAICCRQHRTMYRKFPTSAINERKRLRPTTSIRFRMNPLWQDSPPKDFLTCYADDGHRITPIRIPIARVPAHHTIQPLRW
ncbi:MAG: hypothetical protein JWL69_3941 [Phycisphaerales bacterium]|jgi:hypothetical protein|nr:hypothetical protein [Phycisphaerales bacterium]